MRELRRERDEKLRTEKRKTKIERVKETNLLCNEKRGDEG
jgi:hypothetical protein